MAKSWSLVAIFSFPKLSTGGIVSDELQKSCVYNQYRRKEKQKMCFLASGFAPSVTKIDIWYKGGGHRAHIAAQVLHTSSGSQFFEFFNFWTQDLSVSGFLQC